MSIPQTQIKGTVVLNSDAGAGLTIGNSTATNVITGTTNINTSGTSNTSIGVNGSTTTILGATNINTSGGNVTTIGNLSAGGIINMNSPDINIGTTTSFVNLGTLTGAGQNRLNKPLTPLYESSAIGVNNIGYTVFETLTLGEIAPYGDRNMFPAVTLPKGVWLIQCTGRIFSDNGAGTNVAGAVFWCRDSIDYNARPIFQFGNSNTQLIKTLTNSSSAVITSDGTTSYTIAFYIEYANVAPNIIRLQTTGDYKSMVKRTRIA